MRTAAGGDHGRVRLVSVGATPEFLRERAGRGVRGSPAGGAGREVEAAEVEEDGGDEAVVVAEASAAALTIWTLLLMLSAGPLVARSTTTSRMPHRWARTISATS